MNNEKRISILYYIVSVIFYMVAIIRFTDGDSSSGPVWVCLGSAFLCLGSSHAERMKKAERDRKNEKEDEKL